MHQNAAYQNMHQCMHQNIHATFEFYPHSWQSPWVLSEANSIFLVITTKILPRWSLPSKIYIYAFFFCFLKRSNLFCFQTLYLFLLLSCHLYMKILWYICIHRYYLLFIIILKESFHCGLITWNKELLNNKPILMYKHKFIAIYPVQAIAEFSYSLKKSENLFLFSGSIERKLWHKMGILMEWNFRLKERNIEVFLNLKGNVYLKNKLLFICYDILCSWINKVSKIFS